MSNELNTGMDLGKIERMNLRLERMEIMLQQSTEMIQGLGQYVPNSDPNRTVMEEVIKANLEILRQEKLTREQDGDKLVIA